MRFEMGKINKLMKGKISDSELKNKTKFKIWLYENKNMSEKSIENAIRKLITISDVFTKILDSYDTIFEITDYEFINKTKYKLMINRSYINFNKFTNDQYTLYIDYYSEYIKETYGNTYTSLEVEDAKIILPNAIVEHNKGISDKTINQSKEDRFKQWLYVNKGFLETEVESVLKNIEIIENEFSDNLEPNTVAASLEEQDIPSNKTDIINVKQDKSLEQFPCFDNQAGEGAEQFTSEFDDILLGETNTNIQDIQTDTIINEVYFEPSELLKEIIGMSKTKHAEKNDFNNNNMITPYYELLAVDPQEYKHFKISDFQISMRSINCLNHSSIYTIEDLLRCSEVKIRKIKNLGAKSFKEIKTLVLKQNNFSLENKILLECENKKEHKFKISLELKAIIERIISGETLDTERIQLLSEEEIEYINRIREAIFILGKDICLEIFLQPHQYLEIRDMLSEFNRRSKLHNQLIENLTVLYECIPNERRLNKISPFIKAYHCSCVSKNINISQLEERINTNDTVTDIRNMFKLVNEVKIHDQLCAFLKWIALDINMIINEWFEIQYNNNNIIIKNRSSGKTLAECGQIIGLTRERVRQIEVKAQKKFNLFNKRYNIIMLLYAIRNGDEIITPEEIKKQISNHTSELIYLLKKAPSSDYYYNKNLDIFIIDPEIVGNKVQQFLDELPDTIRKDTLNRQVKKAIEEDDLSYELINKMIEYQYNLSGNTYHRTRLSLSQIYTFVLREYFTSGIKVYNNSEINTFREYVTKEFGLIDLPVQNRAISVRLTDLSVLCERGTYILRDFVDISNKEVFVKIAEYIDNFEEESVSYNQIFEVFQEELLLTTNITNRYFLQGALKLLFDKKYSFKKDIIAHHVNNSNVCLNSLLQRYVIADEIEDFFKGSKGLISICDIWNKIPGLNLLKREYVLNFLQKSSWCNEIERNTFIYSPENIVKSLEEIPECFIKKDRSYMYREFQMISEVTFKIALETEDRITWLLWNSQFEEFVELCLGYGISKVGELLFIPYRNEQLVDRFYYKKLRAIIDKVKNWLNELTKEDDEVDMSTDDILSLFWQN